MSNAFLRVACAALCSRRLLLVAMLAVSAAACGSRSMLQRAEPMAPGESRLSIGVSGGLAADSITTLPTGSVTIDYRLGVARGVDLDARIWPVGGRLGAKLELARSASAVLATEVALVGSGYPQSEPVIYYVGGQVGLLLGVPFGPHELVLEALVTPGYGVASTDYGDGERLTSRGFVVEGGFGIGVDIALGSVVHLMPEVELLARGGEQRDVESVLLREPIVFHGTLGVSFEW